MKYVTSVIILLIIIENSALKLSIPRKTIFPTSDCIAFILKKYFTNIGKISIRNTPTHYDTISDLLTKINFPVFINVDEIPQIHGINKQIPDEINIILDESTNKTKFLNRTIWNTYTQFIVLLTTSSEQVMINIFKDFWHQNIANIILLNVHDTLINIYTFMPYNQYDCHVHKPTLLAKWSSGRMKIYNNIIDRERVKNLNGCILNITVTNLPPTTIFPTEDSWKGTEYLEGIEPKIFAEIADYLNFKPIYAEPPDRKQWGWIEPKPHGVVGQVYEKRSQIGFGSLAMTIDRYENLDITTPTSCVIECVSWAVPVGAKKVQARWIHLFITEFTLNVWYSMIAAFTFTIAAIRILSKNSISDQYDFDGNLKAIFYAFRSSLGSCVKGPESFPLKIVLMTWTWYSFIILSAYTSSMGSKLTVPLRLQDIDTFKDLLESDLEFTGLFATFRLVRNAYQNDEVKAIAARLKETPYGMSEAIEKIIYDRNIAYMRESTTFMYNVKLNPKAKDKVHFMKQCVHNYWAVMVLPKNSILTAKISHVIRTLFEAGLTCEWRSWYLEEFPPHPPPAMKLTLAHLSRDARPMPMLMPMPAEARKILKNREADAEADAG